MIFFISQFFYTGRFPSLSEQEDCFSRAFIKWFYSMCQRNLHNFEEKMVVSAAIEKLNWFIHGHASSQIGAGFYCAAQHNSAAFFCQTWYLPSLKNLYEIYFNHWPQFDRIKIQLHRCLEESTLKFLFFSGTLFREDVNLNWNLRPGKSLTGSSLQVEDKTFPSRWICFQISFITYKKMHYHAKAVKLKMAKVLKIAAAQKWTGLQSLKIELI